MAEVHKLEKNEMLRLVLDSLQTPTVEYKEISVDDYSMSASRITGTSVK